MTRATKDYLLFHGRTTGEAAVCLAGYFHLMAWPRANEPKPYGRTPWDADRWPSG